LLSQNQHFFAIFFDFFGADLRVQNYELFLN
jgi:hypothetical protein